MSSTEQPELLCRVNFPLYQATMVTERHILFAGGGGAAGCQRGGPGPHPGARHPRQGGRHGGRPPQGQGRQG